MFREALLYGLSPGSSDTSILRGGGRGPGTMTSTDQTAAFFWWPEHIAAVYVCTSYDMYFEQYIHMRMYMMPCSAVKETQKPTPVPPSRMVLVSLLRRPVLCHSSSRSCLTPAVVSSVQQRVYVQPELG